MTRSHFMHPARVVLGLCGLAGLVAGCGGGPKLPPMAPVSGSVTLDGKPLPQGTVQFVPNAAQGTAGAPAVGSIGPDGRYTLQTAGHDGAIVGHHKVRVDARRTPKDYMDTMPPSLIPAKYNDPDTSGLVVEVKGGEKNQIPLELKSAP
jgi:hypothetical protein